MKSWNELDQMKQHWQAQSPTGPGAAALRERVTADTHRHQRTLLLVGLVTLLVIALTFAFAWRSARAAAWFTFVFTTAFAALVWLLALLLSRGTWRPRDESTAACLEVAIRRCRSVILAAPIGILLYVAGLVGSLAWKHRVLGTDWNQLLEAPSMVIAGWIGAPLYSLAMLWNAHVHRQRLRVLLDLKRQLGES